MHMSCVAQPVLVSFKNVLLATDLSPASARALEYAIAFDREQSAVHTLHVAGSDNYQLLCPEAFSDTFRLAGTKCRNATKILRGLLHGLPSEVPVHGTRIWEVIADVASRNEIDLLILGSHGRKGLNKFLFGSVAEEVFRHVTCPVLTVSADVKAPGLERLQITKVLLASDFSPKSLAPMYACWLCRRFDAGLVGLHVVSGEEDWRNANVFRVEEQLLNMTPEIADLQQRPDLMVEFGEPADKILQAAGETGADLIVLGAHAPREGWPVSHLPWATAGRVIAGAPCPVLTVRDSWTS
jgi:nucleotide-binding universal stress UspA family protein